MIEGKIGCRRNKRKEEEILFNIIIKGQEHKQFTLFQKKKNIQKVSLKINELKKMSIKQISGIGKVYS